MTVAVDVAAAVTLVVHDAAIAAGNQDVQRDEPLVDSVEEEGTVPAFRVGKEHGRLFDLRGEVHRKAGAERLVRTRMRRRCLARLRDEQSSHPATSDHRGDAGDDQRPQRWARARAHCSRSQRALARSKRRSPSPGCAVARA